MREQRFDVRDNLYHALQDLLQRHSASYIWIGAICINQADIKERNQQVQLMGKIYSQADIVLGYLGPEER